MGMDRILAANGNPGDEDGTGLGLATKTRTRTKTPSPYKVLMLNDDYTPMEFVVHVLQSFFKMSIEDATRVMLHVHQRGVGVCGIFPYEVAETKVAQVIDFARAEPAPAPVHAGEGLSLRAVPAAGAQRGAGSQPVSMPVRSMKLASEASAGFVEQADLAAVALDDPILDEAAHHPVDVDRGEAGGVADLLLGQGQLDAAVLDRADPAHAREQLADQRTDPGAGRGAADRGEPVGERDPVGDAEAEQQGGDARMLADQGGELLAAERAQDGVGDRGHRLGRIGEGEQRQAQYVALEMEAHDLAAAIAEHDAGMEPARADDVELARRARSR